MSNPVRDSLTERQLDQLFAGPLYRFQDWPNEQVPNLRAGVYTVWNDDELVYVGMAGRALAASDQRDNPVAVSSKPRGLRDRLRSHASGRRSGDQFCVYVCDRLVLPTLTEQEIADIADGQLSLDQRTRHYIHDRLSYRFVTTDDGVAAFALERRVQRGERNGVRPLLNPL